MPQSIEDLSARLFAATRPGAREALVRRGLARGLIWRDGRLPAGAPQFADSLTADLLDHGYAVLEQALRLREMSGASANAEHALRVAAESIESAVRRGEADDDRDFHLVVASCAFHLAHYGARAFCLAPSLDAQPNLSTPERALVGLMRREFVPLKAACARWLRAEGHDDAGLATLIERDGADTLEEIERVAITTNFVRSLATLLTALERGDGDLAGRATAGFSAGAEAAATCRHIPLWWTNVLARHLTDDLWANSMHVRIPMSVGSTADVRWSPLRRRYIDVLRDRSTAEIDLWPSQWEAARRCIDTADDLVVALPTSAGKTRVAELCILRSLADDKRVVYVTPLRALSAQLERTLAKTFRPLGFSVTALYGASGVAAVDVSTLRDADIVVATPEKLDFALRIDPAVLDDVGLVVLDEAHMIGLGTREIRYEVLVQRLLRRSDASLRRIVCLSALFAPTASATEAQPTSAGPAEVGAAPVTQGSIAFEDFTSWIRSDAPGTPVTSSWRPTRQRTGVLRWTDSGGRLEITVDEETPFVPSFVRAETATRPRRLDFPKDSAEFVLAAAKAFLADDQRVLVYCPQRRSVESLGEAFLTVERQRLFVLPEPPPEELERALRIGREWLGPEHVAIRTLAKGVALHHGALPRPFLTEIEDLLHRRLLRLAIASPTLAQGIDLSCSVLIFRSIYRFGDEVISPEEFSNVIGRAGRAHVDLDGVTVFPVFETGRPGARRVAAFRQLVRDSAARRLESGLLLLVEQLVRLLSQALGVSSRGLRDYVLDLGSQWDVQVFETNSEGEPVRELVAPLLAELDAALLGSVDDLNCATEALADALDIALRASLWTRRLQRRETSVAITNRDLILGRARWIWQRTSTASRRGYHAAGIGFTTGQFLDEQRDTLVPLLWTAETNLKLGELDAAAAALVQFAGIVSTMPPFAFEDAAAGWESALTEWVKGEPVGLSLARVDQADSIVAFLQGDVVYRLVWAAEAVRLHAVQTGVSLAESLEGTAAASLTYGLPTATGVALAQAGLPSRAMIQHLLAAFPTTLTTMDALSVWLAEKQPAIDTPGFWADAATKEIWQVFYRRWTSARTDRWIEAEITAEVRWLDNRATPQAGANVSLVYDVADATTYVCQSDLSPLGRLVTSLSPELHGVSGAVVSADPDYVTISVLRA